MSAGPYSLGSAHWPGVSKLIEELGELQQVLGKLIATNGDAAHWDGSDLRLRARLGKPRPVLGQWPQRLAAHADLIERLARL